MSGHCSSLWFRLDVLSTLQVPPPETGLLFCIYYTIEYELSKLELNNVSSREPLPSPLELSRRLDLSRRSRFSVPGRSLTDEVAP
jgi:hypothetical protein